MITIIKNTINQVTFEKDDRYESWFNHDCSNSNILKQCDREGDEILRIQFEDGEHLASILHVYFDYEKDLFVDFTTLKWVKWTSRKPSHNGSVYMRFNGKNVGNGLVFNGELHKLDGLSSDEFENYIDTFYWLEEIIDLEKFREYRNNC